MNRLNNTAAVRERNPKRRRWSRSRWTPETVRGATDAEGNQTHLLAAATHQDCLVLGQVEVGAKTNEIPMFAPLLENLAAAGVDLGEVVITADALCRYRHNASYADLRIMPMSGPKALVVAVSVVVRSA